MLTQYKQEKNRLLFVTKAIFWLILILFELNSSSVFSQSNITGIEYYLDTDPGIGKATSLNFTPSKDISDLIIPLNPNNISEGVHRFYVRAKDANNSWGLVNRWLFYKPYGNGGLPPDTLPRPNITRVEYYLDADPGLGKATSLSITSSKDIADLIIPLNPDSISEGVHRFYIRAKDANNSWSLVNRWLFYKPYGNGGIPPVYDTANLIQLEYYVDTDPGYGSGTQISTIPKKDISDLIIPLDIDSLDIGYHTIYVRAKNASGNWSLVNSLKFKKPAPSQLQIKIGTIKSNLCVGDSVLIPYTVTGSFASKNTFIAQISDKQGIFENAIDIGSVPTNASGTIHALIPSNLPIGSNYHIRIVASSPKDTSDQNGTPLIIGKPPAQSYAILGNSNPCLGTQEYTSSVIESNVKYTWSLSDGGTLDTSGATATVSWNKTGTFTIKLQASNTCGAAPQVELIVTVSNSNPIVSPAISHSGRTLFIVDPDQALSYQWYKNGSKISGATQTNYLAGSAGTYTAKYLNNCGEGPLSNGITFNENSQQQTITFNPIPAKIFGDSPFTLTATSNSLLPVSYSIITGPALIQGDTLVITGAGTVIVEATQPGDDIYTPALAAQQTFIINKAQQAISFDTITDKKYGDAAFYLNATSSAGLPVYYIITSGYASISGNQVYLSGAGSVTIKAQQDGNQNYAAAFSERTFCVHAAIPDTINGFNKVCISSQQYYIDSIPGVNYTWTLSGGGNLLTKNGGSVIVNWIQKGTFLLTVKLASNCEHSSIILKTLTVEITDPQIPGSVANMYPPNGTIVNTFPFSLSWKPALNAQLYDVYIWPDSVQEPSEPIIYDLTQIAYPVYQGSPIMFEPGVKYNWKVVSKNACKQFSGNTQSFKVSDLPNLYIKDLQVPDSMFSGGKLDVMLTVGNDGKASTGTGEWTDAVYLSADSILSTDADIYLTGKGNQSILNITEQYTSTISALLPENRIGQYYIITVTNAYQQLAEITDTDNIAIKALPIILTPPPDLQVTSVITPGDAFTATLMNFTYTVKNKGSGNTRVNNWMDRIYISPDSAFDINTSMLLDSISHYSDSLRPDSSYTRSVAVTLPSRFFGREFIHVVTDANNSVYEFTFENNNSNRSDSINIFLTPPPDFVVTNAAIPALSSSGENIHINYSVQNQGATKPLNIERAWADGIYISKDSIFDFKNAKRLAYTYALTRKEERDCPVYDEEVYDDRYVIEIGQGTGSSNGGSNSGGGGGIISHSDVVIYGNIGSGGSASGGGAINTTNNTPGCVTADGSNITGVYKDSAGLFYTGAYLCGTAFYYPVMDHDEIYNNSIYATIPDTLPGTYYLYLYTDLDDAVFEYQKENNNTFRSKIEIINPDLTVTNISAADTAFSGTNITASWTIKNQGLGNVFGANRKDLIWLSRSPAYDTSQMIRIDSLTYCNEITNSNTTTLNKSVRIPDGVSGSYHLLIETDADHQIYEGNNDYNNYITKPIKINLTPWADLQPSNVQLHPDTTYMEQNIGVNFRITNAGIGDLSGKLWKDRIYISAQPTWDSLSSTIIKEYSRSQTLPIQSYYDVADSIAPSVQDLGRAGIDSLFYMYIYTDPTNAIYEYTGETNNIKRSNVVHVIQPDLDVTNVPGPDSAFSGQFANIQWSVKNIGARTGLHSSSWIDRIYLSVDTVLDQKDTLVTERSIVGPLLRNNAYQQNMAIAVPNGISGDYYLFANADYNNANRDKNTDNNIRVMRDENGKPKPLHITLTKSPDLIVTSVVNPSAGYSGQPVTVKWTVTNTGIGTTMTKGWSDRIYISTDENAITGGEILGTYTRNGDLDAGSSYTGSLQVFLPLWATGNYYIVIKTDAGDAVYEHHAEDNNVGSNLIFVIQPPPSDLIVTDVSLPDTATIGDSVIVSWKIKNIGKNPAFGYFKEGVYFSGDSLSNANGIFLADTTEQINIPPGSTALRTKKVKLKGFIPGLYFASVKTDLTNNIIEDNEDNNFGFSSNKINVGVLNLPINVLTPNILKNNDELYYQMVIPDSLSGETMLISLRGDTVYAANELYIGYENVPTRASYDFAYDKAVSGNQDVVIPVLNKGTYYILAYGASTKNIQQNITLLAQKINFSIFDVNAREGGNTGLVTVKVKGAKFEPSMKITLHSNSLGTIPAYSIQYISSTSLFVTFNLAGAKTGVYDVIGTKGTKDSATLFNGFTIIAGSGGGFQGGGISGDGFYCTLKNAGVDLLTGIDVQYPPSVNVGRGMFNMTINFGNSGNVDIPAPHKILVSLSGTPVSLTQSGLSEGKTELYLEFKELNGPEGILRPGATGSITIYTLPVRGLFGYKLIE